MSESITSELFSAHLGDTFGVSAQGTPPIDVQLVEVTRSHQGRVADHAGATDRPFSVVFRGPGPCALPQRTYRFEHADLGNFELFIVPIGPDGSGMLYEAVFG